MAPSGPLTGPGQEQQPPQDGAGPGTGGGFPSPAPPQADPRSAQVTEWILQIVALSRRIGMMYPAALPEIRMIHDAAQKLQPKILASHPGNEPAAPPV